MNITRSEVISILKDVANGNITKLDSEKVEEAAQFAIQYIDNNELEDTLKGALDSIFEMYRRDDEVDKSYRNAARFIKSSVLNEEVEYELCNSNDIENKNKTLRTPQERRKHRS